MPQPDVVYSLRREKVPCDGQQYFDGPNVVVDHLHKEKAMAAKTVADILAMKKAGEKITILTAYDVNFARMIDAAEEMLAQLDFFEGGLAG